MIWKSITIALLVAVFSCLGKGQWNLEPSGQSWETFSTPAWFLILFPSHPCWWSRTCLGDFPYDERKQLEPHLPLYGHVVLLPLLLFTPVIIKPLLAHAVLQCFVGKSAASQRMGRWVWPCPDAVKGKDLEQRGCAITATPFVSSEGQKQESLSSTGQAQNANQCPATAAIFTCNHFSVLFVFDGYGADTSAVLLYFGLTLSCWSCLS